MIDQELSNLFKDITGTELNEYNDCQLKTSTEIEELSSLFNGITGTELNEYVGDNKIDNLADELKRSAEIELKMFATSLLQTNLNLFLQAFVTPQFASFKTCIDAITDRYRVMDDQERLDLFQKMELMFKEIFINNFSALGPETAELIASRYAQQMVKHLKDNNKDPQQAIDLLYPHRRDINAKAEPVGDTIPNSIPSPDETWQAKVQAKMNMADLMNDKSTAVLVANPY